MNEQNDILKALQEKRKSSNQLEGYPFTVAENYFEELENQILLQVATNDIVEQMPFPAQKSKAAFSVPEGYFHNLEKNILEKAAPKPAKVFAFKRWISAAAAVILMVIVIGGLYNRNPKTSSNTMVQNTALTQPVINDISVDELTDFAEEQAPAQKNTIAGGQNQDDTNQLFRTVSNRDLEGFLNEKSTGSGDLF